MRVAVRPTRHRAGQRAANFDDTGHSRDDILDLARMDVFSPPVMTMSFFLSTMVMKPSWSATAISPTRPSHRQSFRQFRRGGSGDRQTMLAHG